MKKKKMLQKLFCVLFAGTILCTSTYINGIDDVNATVGKFTTIEDADTALADLIPCQDYSDFSKWRTGCYYYTNGAYAQWQKTRICLKELEPCSSETVYAFWVSDSSYHILVREMDANRSFLKSHDLNSNERIKTLAETKYLAISLYSPSKDTSLTFADYETLFRSGFRMRTYTQTEWTNDEVSAELQENEAATNENLAEFYRNWRTGQYGYTTGLYETSKSRICHKDYDEVNAGMEYKVTVTDSKYQMLIRELDANGKFICTSNLKNGQKLMMKSNTKKVGISIYNPSTTSIDYTHYESLFRNGFQAKLTQVGVIDSSDDLITSPPADNSSASSSGGESLLSKPFTDIKDWRAGHYHWSTGLYEPYKGRICRNDYDAVKASTKYKVTISKTGFQMLIREMDANGNFVATHNLKDGGTMTTTAKTAKVGLSIYHPTNQSYTYADYETMFANGFSVSFMEANVVEDQVGNVTSPKPTTPREIIKNLLETGDLSKHDISEFKLTYSQCNAIWEDLIKNECWIANGTHFGCFLNVSRNADGTIKEVWLDHANENFAEDYAKVLDILAELKSEMKGMSDLDKVVYAHEYIVSNTRYYNDGYDSYSGGCTLANRYGVCEGYAKALQMILRDNGVDTKYLSSSKMNHGWVMVKVDGKYYHIDPTWDCTRKGTNQEYYHYFLLRNDTEMSETLTTTTLHYGWNVSYKDTLPVSNSTTYSNWFVHSVSGKMYYYNGYWYYKNPTKNTITRSKIDGSQSKNMISVQTKNVKLLGIEDGYLKYQIGSKAYKIQL